MVLGASSIRDLLCCLKKNSAQVFMTSKGVICSYFTKYFNCCICQYKHHIRCAKG